MTNIILYDINGKRVDSLYQWNYNVSIKIGGAKTEPVPEIRCWNKNSKVANRVDAEITNGFVKFVVPNELLQDCSPINIQLFYCYDSGDSKTEYHVVIPVSPGKKPDGYVYSPTEISTLDALEERIKALENNGNGCSQTDSEKIYYNAKIHGAKGDGVTDDSPALNALVQTVHAAGGGTIWLPKGVYMLDSPIIWASNVSLRGEGIGISMLKTRQAAGVGEGFAAIRGRKVTHFTADNPCENATFEQFTIDGSEMQITQYTSWPKGINIHFMRNSVFRDLEIRNTKATGLGIDMLENVTIDGIFLYNCGAGAYVDNAEINEGGAGIGIGTWGMPQESFIIRNCVADGCGRYGIFLERQGGTSDDCIANYIIANNIVKNGRKHGIVVKGGSRVNVTGNICYNNAQYGMAVLENNGFLTDVVKFSGNLSYDNGVGFAVDTEDARAEDIFCAENIISGCDTGVLVRSSVDGLMIARNTIKRCTKPVVIEGGSQHNFVYRDNILLDNGSQPRTTATFTGSTDYIDELKIGHPTRVEIPAAELLLGIKIMPDGSEAADAVAQSTGFVDVQGMGGTVAITTLAETWDSKDSARVAQYGTDKVCLQESAPTYSVANDNPNELTVELLDGCAYIRIFYGAGVDKTVPAALTSVVVESEA